MVGNGLTRFVVLAAPRTGSNWLCSLLDSHPQILCHHEIFNPERVIYAVSCRDGRLDLGTVAERNADPLRFLAGVWQHPCGHPIVGFKLNRDQEPRAFEQVLADPGIRKLLLYRRNRVRTYVSEHIALATGEWESYPWSRRSPRQIQLEVDAATLRAHAERNQRYYDGLRRVLEEASQPVLELCYEQLGEPRELQRALDFLGAAGHAGDLQGATRKQNAAPLSQLIANFNDLAAQLRGSDLAAELAEAAA